MLAAEGEASELWRAGLEEGKLWREVGVFLDLGPCQSGWGSQDLEDLEELTDLAYAFEQRSSLDDFVKNASNRPDIDAVVIVN